ncbi:hypothetical protein [Sphingomonas bacterium]|uniref:hypothetical protein n=1 Tax=Sphingomonas bacterium TaxID=1895847 RepID=UPI0015767DE6|nr:hypothetical protein [Sphingomonas bacterium]
MNLRFIDWIWHIRGSLALPLGLSRDAAFDRLDPLFREAGTSREWQDGTLTFRKKDQASQDKMSIFDGGVLRIEQGRSGSVLRYHLTSRALLACFLAPLLFLGIAQFTKVVIAHETAKADAAAKAEGPKKPEKKDKALPLNPIDKFLGSPAPEKPKKKGADKDKGRKGPSTTPAYVFAGIFAFLYVGGRILEDWLAKRLFRKRLLPS